MMALLAKKVRLVYIIVERECWMEYLGVMGIVAQQTDLNVMIAENLMGSLNQDISL